MSDGVELDRRARELIEAGREGPVPSEFAAERVRRAVASKLRGAPAGPPKVRRPTKILIGAFAVALGGALYATEQLRSSSDEPAPQHASRAAAPPPMQPRTAPPAPSPVSNSGADSGARAAPAIEATASAAPAPRASARSASNARPESASALSRSRQLAAEIELLARVNSAVNAGDGARALASLREYDGRFGAGILAEERAAASVLSLCAAGRQREARAEAQRFARRWSRSPLLARVEGSCAQSN